MPTYDTYTTQDDNVHFQQNPAYEAVYPMRPNIDVYQEWEVVIVTTLELIASQP